MVWRPGHHALVQRCVDQGGVCQLHGSQDLTRAFPQHQPRPEFPEDLPDAGHEDRPHAGHTSHTATAGQPQRGRPALWQHHLRQGTHHDEETGGADGRHRPAKRTAEVSLQLLLQQCHLGRPDLHSRLGEARGHAQGVQSCVGERERHARHRGGSLRPSHHPDAERPLRPRTAMAAKVHTRSWQRDGAQPPVDGRHDRAHGHHSRQAASHHADTQLQRQRLRAVHHQPRVCARADQAPAEHHQRPDALCHCPDTLRELPERGARQRLFHRTVPHAEEREEPAHRSHPVQSHAPVCHRPGTDTAPTAGGFHARHCQRQSHRLVPPEHDAAAGRRRHLGRGARPPLQHLADEQRPAAQRARLYQHGLPPGHHAAGGMAPHHQHPARPPEE